MKDSLLEKEEKLSKATAKLITITNQLDAISEDKIEEKIKNLKDVN